MKKIFSLRFITLSVILLSVTSLSLFGIGLREDSSGAVPVKGRIRLSTTTSTQDSGLLDYLLPVFTRETGWAVDVIAVGTGAALRMGEGGDADVLLVHARADELQFMKNGYGIVRYDVMYNDFLVVGPTGVIPHNSNVIQTFKDIAARNLPFVSRGDDSGTHRMELNLWKSAEVNDVKSMRAYSSVGQGMGATLQMADEMQAYTLTDRATWLTLLKDKRINLQAVCENAPDLLNYYGVIVVNPARHPRINVEGGQAFAEWMVKYSTQRLIGQYGLAEFGGALFTPNAGANQ